MYSVTQSSQAAQHDAASVRVLALKQWDDGKFCGGWVQTHTSGLLPYEAVLCMTKPTVRWTESMWSKHTSGFSWLNQGCSIRCFEGESDRSVSRGYRIMWARSDMCLQKHSARQSLASHMCIALVNARLRRVTARSCASWFTGLKNNHPEARSRITWCARMKTILMLSMIVWGKG